MFVLLFKERLNIETNPACTATSPEISGGMERLRLNDPELDAVIKEHRDTCLEMGYLGKDFEIATRKLVAIGMIISFYKLI